MGKYEAVALYSGHMFESVARFGTDSDDSPFLKNSMNLLMMLWARSIFVSVSMRSVVVVLGGSVLTVRMLIMMGSGRNMGWLSIGASASMPPTFYFKTPSLFIIVVCESVLMSVLGIATSLRIDTTCLRCSRFT